MLRPTKPGKAGAEYFHFQKQLAMRRDLYLRQAARHLVIWIWRGLSTPDGLASSALAEAVLGKDAAEKSV